MKQRIYLDYLEDIAQAIYDIEIFVGNLTYKEFITDRKTSLAVIRSLEIMGEASKKIPSSIRNKYPSIQWKRISGMRDKLIHEYFGVDNEILWQVIKKDIPVLKKKIMKIISATDRIL